MVNIFIKTLNVKYAIIERQIISLCIYRTNKSFKINVFTELIINISFI